MNKIASKITSDIVDRFMPFAEKMRAECRTDQEVERAFRNFMGLAARKTIKPPPMKSIRSIIGGMKLLDQFEKNKASRDSNTEAILFDMLKDEGIPFLFQEKIGPYRIDFIVWCELIVEIDGPHHSKQKEYDANRDAYLKKMGYKIMRIPARVFLATPKAVIEAIKETTCYFKA